MIHEEFFNKLSKTLRDANVTNTVVFSGDGNKFDFIIVSEPLKTVFIIDVKTNAGAHQLKSGMEFLKQSLVLLKEAKWNFVEFIYLDEEAKEHSRFVERQKYVLGPKTDFDEWWKNINLADMTKIMETEEKTLNDNSYVLICKALLSQMCLTSELITETNTTKKSCSSETHITKSNTEKIITLTGAQYSTLRNQHMKRVILASDFGTGKSLILKAKAKELLKIEERVVIVLFDDDKTKLQFLLNKKYDQEFQSFANFVKVEIIKTAGITIFCV